MRIVDLSLEQHDGFQLSRFARGGLSMSTAELDSAQQLMSQGYH